MLEDIQEARKDKLNKVLREIDAQTPVQYASSAGCHELSMMRMGY